MTVWIGDIIGQLALVKGNGRSIHPLFPGRRRIGVNIKSRGQLRVGLASHHPTGIVKLVPTVVFWLYVH